MRNRRIADTFVPPMFAAVCHVAMSVPLRV
jgi:hypothetical protein